MPAVNAAIQNVTLAQRKATFSQASTHRCDSENTSILSLSLHVAYLSLTQCSFATLSRKLILSLGKSIRLANCTLKLHTQHNSCTQYHSHSATFALRHTRTQPRPRLQQNSHSVTLALKHTRAQTHSHSARLALSQTRIQAQSHLGTLAISHTRISASTS